ncbi:MAG TPA: farnesyl diphosphate synthase [Gemmatimonadaceae bacterium]|nr:farnesyl diphosphate synthase [Gemmatimonadaceae bacterium]
MSDAFEADREKIEAQLDAICASDVVASLPGRLGEAIRYALKSPGKRIRPLLVQLSYRAAGGAGDSSLLACAPEVIHAYSLVHDDLPCMDDDDVRRGRPTVHKVFGNRVAILAGVAMIPLAARAVRHGAQALHLAPGTIGSILDVLLEAAGAGGMIGGQLRDLTGEGIALSLTERESIHSAKTGALINASVRVGALAAGATEDQLEAFGSYGRTIGLAFQIMDDVLDVTATTSVMGKTTGRDAALGKSTYPALLGVDAARKRASSLIDDGLESLEKHGLLTQELTQVANFMVTRTS